MRSVLTAMTLSAGLIAAGCVDNEQSLYIEHIKMQPDPPACEVNSGDARAASGVLDLAIAWSYSGWYYVTNGTMAREENENLRAESDGIFIEGAEVFVTGAGGSTVGATEYFEFQHYIPPESSDVVAAVTVPASVVAGLADELGCQRVENFDMEEYLQTEGMTLPRTEYYSAIYSNVRFLGHTQSAVYDVESQVYSFLIQPCCNCLMDWSNCTTGCSAFCEDPDDIPVCNAGTANGVNSEVLHDCRMYTHNEDASWTEYDIYGNEQTMDCSQCGGSSSD